MLVEIPCRNILAVLEVYRRQVVEGTGTHLGTHLAIVPPAAEVTVLQSEEECWEIVILMLAVRGSARWTPRPIEGIITTNKRAFLRGEDLQIFLINV